MQKQTAMGNAEYGQVGNFCGHVTDAAKLSALGLRDYSERGDI